MSLPQLWPEHHQFLPLIFQCHSFQKAPHPCRLPQVCFRHWNSRFGPVRAQCSGTLTEDSQSICLVSVTTTRGGLVCVNRLGRELLYELVMKGNISRPFFFNIILSVYFGPHRVSAGTCALCCSTRALVVALRLGSGSAQPRLPYSKWDRSPPSRGETWVRCVGRQVLSP